MFNGACKIELTLHIFERRIWNTKSGKSIRLQFLPTFRSYIGIASSRLTYSKAGIFTRGVAFLSAVELGNHGLSTSYK